MPQSVVVVGGSIAGLIHGLQHKRRGNNVTILEQETGERHSHHAGIGFMSHLQSFLSKYDRTGVTPAFTYDSRHFAYYRRPNLLTVAATQNLTSWGFMQRILRANFDGTPFAACPQPPSDAETDGASKYLAGKRVTALAYSDSHGTVTVYYDDVNTGKQDSIQADLVIGADGVHSTIRQLVKANKTTRYSGYIAWRGTLPEKMVSPETIKYFSNRITFNFSNRGYLVW
jgi:2-polyprenyl-6-methoxyphenol hydroxylase-like FAD-dependent oxidoreductase